MNKLIILGFLAVISACVAQNDVDPPPPVNLNYFDNSRFALVRLYLTVVKSNLPPQFLERALQVVVEAEAKLDNCDEQFGEGLWWVHKVCTTTVVRTARLQVNQVFKEAALFSATSTVAPEVAA